MILIRSCRGNHDKESQQRSAGQSEFLSFHMFLFFSDFEVV